MNDHILHDLTCKIQAKNVQIAQLEIQLAAYGRSHLGILSGPAIRYELTQLTQPVDLVVFDWRKQNEWNGVLGWDGANAQLGQAARVDYAGVNRRSTTRGIDLRGQWGGDEIVCAVDPGHGRRLLARLLSELVAMNQHISVSHRADILERTGGLIDRFCIAAVLVEATTRPFQDARRAVDATGVLKAGVSTGSRASSGARGTVLGWIKKGERA